MQVHVGVVDDHVVELDLEITSPEERPPERHERDACAHPLGDDHLDALGIDDAPANTVGAVEAEAIEAVDVNAALEHRPEEVVGGRCDKAARDRAIEMEDHPHRGGAGEDDHGTEHGTRESEDPWKTTADLRRRRGHGAQNASPMPNAMATGTPNSVGWIPSEWSLE